MNAQQELDLYRKIEQLEAQVVFHARNNKKLSDALFYYAHEDHYNAGKTVTQGERPARILLDRGQIARDALRDVARNQ